MRQTHILGIAVVIIVIAAGGYLGWTYMNTNSNQNTPTPTSTLSPTLTPVLTATPDSTSNPTPTLTPDSEESPSPEASTQEQVRDDIMAYIKTNHANAAPYISDSTWVGGRTTPEGAVGAETYSYTYRDWNVTMQYPVIVNPVYTVTAKFTPTHEAPILEIVWQGTWQSGAIAETSYTANERR